MQEATREELRNLIARYILEGGTWEEFRQMAKEEFDYRQGEARVQLEKECGEFRQRVRDLLTKWIPTSICPCRDREWVEELIVRAYIYRLTKSRYTVKNLLQEVAETTGNSERYICQRVPGIVKETLLLVAKHTDSILDLEFYTTANLKNVTKDMNALLNFLEKDVKILL